MNSNHCVECFEPPGTLSQLAFIYLSTIVSMNGFTYLPCVFSVHIIYLMLSRRRKNSYRVSIEYNSSLSNNKSKENIKRARIVVLYFLLYRLIDARFEILWEFDKNEYYMCLNFCDKFSTITYTYTYLYNKMPTCSRERFRLIRNWHLQSLSISRVKGIFYPLTMRMRFLFGISESLKILYTDISLIDRYFF